MNTLLWMVLAVVLWELIGVASRYGSDWLFRRRLSKQLREPPNDLFRERDNGKFVALGMDAAGQDVRIEIPFSWRIYTFDFAERDETKRRYNIEKVDGNDFKLPDGGPLGPWIEKIEIWLGDVELPLPNLFEKFYMDDGCGANFRFPAIGIAEVSGREVHSLAGIEDGR